MPQIETPWAPPGRLARRRAERELHRVQKAAGPDQMVCGATNADGSPAFFVMPRDASDDAIEARAFELKHGRRIEPGELILLRAARKMREKRDA